MLRTATLIAALLAPSLVLAQAGVGPLNRNSSLGTLLSTTTLDASSTSITWDAEMKQGSWGELIIYVTVTDGSNSVTALNMTCYGSKNGGTTLYTLQSISVASGVGTSYDASWTKDPSAITSPKRWIWRVDIEGIEDAKCIFTDTGGDASDSISAIVDLAVKGG